MAKQIDSLAIGLAFNTGDLKKGATTVRGELRSVHSTVRSLQTPLERLERKQEQLRRTWERSSDAGRQKLEPAMRRLKMRIDETRRSQDALNRSTEKAANLRGNLAAGLGAAGVNLPGAGLASRFSALAGAGPVGGAVGGAALGATAAVGLAGVTAKVAVNQADYAVSLADTADRLGDTLIGLQGFRHAAALTGVRANQADMALQRMTRRIAEAAQGQGEAVGALEELGLNARELARMRPSQQIRQVADAFQDVSSRSDQIRLAFKLFDSEGVGLVNTLDKGAAGLDRAEQMVKNLGAAVTPQQVRTAREFQATMAELQLSFMGLANVISRNLMPSIRGLAENAAAIASGGRRPLSEVGGATRTGILRGAANLTGLVPGGGMVSSALRGAAGLSGVDQQRLAERDREQANEETRREIAANRRRAQQRQSSAVLRTLTGGVNFGMVGQAARGVGDLAAGLGGRLSSFGGQVAEAGEGVISGRIRGLEQERRGVMTQVGRDNQARARAAASVTTLRGGTVQAGRLEQQALREAIIPQKSATAATEDLTKRIQELTQQLAQIQSGGGSAETAFGLVENLFDSISRAQAP